MFNNAFLSKHFMNDLIAWYRAHGRDLPWRKTTNPYEIVVSEIMLQQTQVDRVIPKYQAWLRAFPSWNELAKAPKADVLTAWSGLGYNSRAIRLQLLARVVTEQGFPQDEEELRKMPGIGPYTAGAVMAFAFDKPGVFIDVNVERVLKRHNHEKKKRPSKELIEKELLQLQDDHSPRELANALMDLGSMFCTATNPKCPDCPVRSSCQSRGERPEEGELRAKKRQSTFLHSNRWWRGQILKQLTTKPYSQTELKESILPEGTGFEEALKQLEKEGLVMQSDTLQLAK